MSDQQRAEAGRRRLASALTVSGALATDWTDAYRAVPRDWFIPDQAWARGDSGRGAHWRIDRDTDPEAWWAAVSGDSPITVQFSDGAASEGDQPSDLPSSSNSMPTMVFSMLAALDIGEDKPRVLEIGTGTGWNAALLAHRLGPGQVVSVEYDPQVLAQARLNLAAAGAEVETIEGDGTDGWAAGAPYDRIIATCSVETVPLPWLAQTRSGGMILAPVGPRFGGEGIVKLTVDDTGAARGPFVMTSGFMRLRQQRAPGRRPIDYLGGQQWPADGTASRTDLSPEEVMAFEAKFAVGVQLPGLDYEIERYTSGAYTLWLVDGNPAGTSWATVDWAPDQDTYEVVQRGPRQLWDEVSRAWAWWDGRGRPDIDRFGLSVTPSGEQRYWLDSADNPVP